jgi:hypothetical protein
MIRSICLALLFANAAPVAATAQTGNFVITRIAVGDDAVRTHLIEPYEARWSVTVATPDNRLVERGHLVERLERGECAQACWRRTAQVLSAAGVETSHTVNVFDAATLAPITTEQVVTDGTVLRLAFSGRRVQGRQNVGAFFHIPEHRRDIGGRLRRPAFDLNNGPTGLYLALMPHRPMTTLRIPIIDVDAEQPTRVVDADYRIFNRQMITVSGRNQEAVAIDAFTTYGYWQYWVVPEAPYVVRWLYVGPGGGRTIYNLVSAPG